jgi:hypothetical protein
MEFVDTHVTENISGNVGGNHAPKDLVILTDQNDYMEPDYIIDNIYLGSEDSSSVYDKLQELNITHILVIGEGLTMHFPDKIRYL